MISHKHRCIFIHIPKCAGTSIEKALGHFDALESANSNVSNRGRQDHRSLRILESPLPYNKVFSSKDNFSDFLERGKRCIRKKSIKNNNIRLTPEQYKSYYKFSFVRNPWARAYSWFKNAVRDERHRAIYGISADISFEEFLPKFIGKGMLRPQTYWLKNFDGKIDMDYVGHFESLHEDFAKICEDANFGALELPHEVKGGETHYAQAYSPRLIDLVADYYQEEISLFDYEYSS